MACALSTPPVAADDPIGGAMATLAAATAQAQAVLNAQRATSAALSARGTAQAQAAMATAQAFNAQATTQAYAALLEQRAQAATATRAALDEVNRQRAVAATADAAAAESTLVAVYARATEHARSAAATARADALNAQATATSQAIVASAYATEVAHSAQTQKTRRERNTLGLLAVEVLAVLGLAWIVFRLTRGIGDWGAELIRLQRPAPHVQVPLKASGVVVEQERSSTSSDCARPEEARMPEMIQVVDDPRMVEAIDRWAERYDAEHPSTALGTTRSGCYQDMGGEQCQPA
jgi:hypothetical protein